MLIYKANRVAISLAFTLSLMFAVQTATAHVLFKPASLDDFEPADQFNPQGYASSSFLSNAALKNTPLENDVKNSAEKFRSIVIRETETGSIYSHTEESASSKIAPNIQFTLSSKKVPSAFLNFYKKGGTLYSNPSTKMKLGKPTKKDACNLYYIALSALCRHDYYKRTGEYPKYFGIQSSLPSLTSSDMTLIKGWLGKEFSGTKIGNLPDIVKGYADLVEEMPLDEFQAMDSKIEHVYAIGDSRYIVSAMAYYGEPKRYGYDIGLEQGKDGWIVYFVDEMWNADEDY